MTALAFTVPGSPLPWQRTNTYGGARLTSNEQRAYQKRVREAARLAWLRSKQRVSWPTDARYEVQVIAYWPDRRQRDVDNVLKQALDSIQGVLFANDCQVDHVTAARGAVDKADPRLVVLVRAMTQGESEAAAQALDQMMESDAVAAGLTRARVAR